MNHTNTANAAALAAGDDDVVRAEMDRIDEAYQNHAGDPPDSAPRWIEEFMFRAYARIDWLRAGWARDRIALHRLEGTAAIAERNAVDNRALALRQTERAERAEAHLAELSTRMTCGHPRAALDAAMGVCTVCELVQRMERAESQLAELKRQLGLSSRMHLAAVAAEIEAKAALGLAESRAAVLESRIDRALDIAGPRITE